MTSSRSLRRRAGSLWPLLAVLAPLLAAPVRAAEPLGLPSGGIVLPRGPHDTEKPADRRPMGGHMGLTNRLAMAMAEKDPEEPEDLTELSLEQLLDLKITTINVLGGHTHLRGQAMVSYQYMLMDMGGYLNGTNRLTNAQVLQRFPTIHTGMTMEMHMLELMYAPSDDLTLMAMLPYKVMSMQHLTRSGTRFPTSASGLGDVQVMALYTFLGDQRKGGNRLLLNAGLSFPTGSITKADFVPGKGVIRLEYPMQLGSGTVDLMPGVTYLGDSKYWAWGAQALGTVRLGRNGEGYRFGNQIHLTTWGVYRLKDWVAPSVRLQANLVHGIRGFDPEINPTSNPEANPSLQSGRRVDLLFGIHFYAPKGPLKDTRLTLEGGFPVYQSLDGPQLKSNWQFSLVLSRVF